MISLAASQAVSMRQGTRVPRSCRLSSNLKAREIREPPVEDQQVTRRELRVHECIAAVRDVIDHVAFVLEPDLDRMCGPRSSSTSRMRVMPRDPSAKRLAAGSAACRYPTLPGGLAKGAQIPEPAWMLGYRTSGRNTPCLLYTSRCV